MAEKKVTEIVDRCVELGLLEVYGSRVMLSDSFIGSIEKVIDIIKNSQKFDYILDKLNDANEMVGFVATAAVAYHLKEISIDMLVDIVSVIEPIVARYLVFRSVT